MQNIELTLKSAVSTSFRCQKAANSLDIDASKKSVHHLLIKDVDLDSDYNLGLIVGASGSGKTTLAQYLFGEDCFQTVLNNEDPVIEQFPKGLSYDECAGLLSGVGLTAVPCWIRPAATLSNGQKSRAEIALQISRMEVGAVAAIDEWTSVVDRTVAKVMSHSIQKHVRREGKKVVLASCHYDVIEWLNPDWIIDCNKMKFVDRRRLRSGFVRKEKLQFDVREVDRTTWRYFSKYHYLSERLPGGFIKMFGLFCGDDQVGFVCYANYVPYVNKRLRKIMHANRLVIHPDYVGLGLGIRFMDECSQVMWDRGFKVMSKFSSTPVYRALSRSKRWRLQTVSRPHKISVGSGMTRRGGFRFDVRIYSFEFIATRHKKKGRPKATQ